jgi:hypothetical protein
MRRTWTPLFALLLAGGTAAAAPEETVEETWRRVVERSELQVELPVIGGDGGRRSVGAPAASKRAGRRWYDGLEGLGHLAEKALWAGIAGGVLLSLLVTVRALMGYRRNAVLEPEAVARAAPAPDRGPDLAAAEAAAQAGRFDEALHGLLLHALARLAARRAAPLPASATGREACRLLCPEPARRAALEELVALVEASLFGGRPATEAAWLRGWETFRALEAPARA